VNLSMLFVVRSLDRLREMGIKLALGAGRARLSRELLFEVLLLACFGGASGLLLAHYALQLLTRWRIPLELPTQFDVQADIRVVFFVVSAVFAAALVSAVAPLWRAWRIDPISSLRSSHEPGRCRACRFARCCWPCRSHAAACS
jgi:putative ABC transport system permease protein